QIHLKPRLLKILQSTGFNPKYLELEVTESVLVQHVSSTIQIMNDLKALGIQISVDDFGTGYSSLIYLKQFPFDTLKIDQRFVRNLTADSRDAAITLAIIQMAHSLNLKVIAEGVETDAELAVLRQNQCDAIQGYLFSRPIPASEFEVFLNTHKTLYSR
ncbi:MAG: EAL domain-containing protein, partial [Desertifilum sp. SIO1I2]|nr:EAL domain-containing protein [Desertifilum sp. SIO1I2]